MQTWPVRRCHGVDIVTNTDKVLMGVSIPGGSVVNAGYLNLVVSTQATINIQEILEFRIDGWVLPVTDLDTAVGYDVVFDQIVPKDKDAAAATPGDPVFDLDVLGSETPEYGGLGDVNWEEMLHIGWQPMHFFKKEVLFNFAQHGKNFVEQTGPVYKFLPQLQFNASFRKKMRVEQPSVLMFTLSNLEAETTVSQSSTPSEDEWFNLRYLGDTLKTAMSAISGNVEAASDHPFQNAMDLVEKYLEPPVFEDTSDWEGTTTLYASGKLRLGVELEGELNINNLSGGGGTNV